MKFCKFPENLIPPKMEFMGINRSETIRRVQQTYRGGSQLRARTVGLLKAHSPSNKASFFAAIQDIKSFIVEYCLNIEYTSKWKRIIFVNFASKISLLVPGIRPFACQTCGKRFNNRGARYNHMKMHSNALPYECPLCQKAFHWELSLKQHLKSHARRGDIMDIMVN
ncbi:Zinc finger protein [Trichinella murrelli]|uniref:Zinc finger protein n=1 Tax=Trichinella murrelli TaxID=144512 RepID=A0A0V0T6T5_9BILA|nr:Zinc finger protein [Trichinella murrelli]KRX34163.1 Zinc finger protein [Trichinella murrelli]